MSLLSLSYWESDVYWRQNNKHFAELAPQNGRKQLIWRNYVTVTLCICQTVIDAAAIDLCVLLAQGVNVRITEMIDSMKGTTDPPGIRRTQQSHLTPCATHATCLPVCPSVPPGTMRAYSRLQEITSTVVDVQRLLGTVYCRWRQIGSTLIAHASLDTALDVHKRHFSGRNYSQSHA